MGQTGQIGASGSSVPSIPSNPSTPTSQLTNKQQRQKRNYRIAYAVLAGLLCLLLAFLAFLTWSPVSQIPVPPARTACSQMEEKLNNGISQVELFPDTREYIGVSDGSFIFDRPRADDQLKCQGALSYRTKAYNDASEWWTKSVLPQNLSGLHYESNDAEALIYREDSRIKSAGLPCETFIVGTILTGNYNGIGRDVLQGAYVAQEEFNRSKTAGKIQLQICLLVANFSSGVRNYQQNGGGSVELKVAQKILDAVDTATSSIKGIIIGLPYTSDATISVLNNNDKHVPVILTGAFSASQMVRVSNTFPVAASVESEGQFAALYAIQHLQARNITVLVYKNDPYSKYLAQAFEDQIDRSRSSDRRIITNYQEYPYTEVAQVNQQNSNMSMIVPKMLKQQNPDMIYFAGNALDANGMLEGLQTANANHVVVMGGDALYEISGYKEKHYKNLFFTSFAFPDEWNVQGKDLDEWAWVPGSEGIGTSQNQHPFPDQYRLSFSGWPLKAYGYSRPDNDAILSFDGTAVLIHGMTIMQQKKNPSDSLQTILTSEKFEGFSGQISFGPNSVAKQVVLLCVGGDGFTKEVLDPKTCQ